MTSFMRSEEDEKGKSLPSTKHEAKWKGGYFYFIISMISLPVKYTGVPSKSFGP